MNEVIAKKYVKALLESLELNELNEINEALGKIDSAFGIEKFIDILILPSLNAKAKADFVLSLTDSTNEKLKNFLYTLATAKRLEILPHIYREFSYQKSLKDNAFKGIIYSSFELSQANKKELEDKFSTKLNANINFDSKKTNYDGIKIELSDLGFEASFSMSLFKAKLSEYILKAIQ